MKRIFGNCAGLKPNQTRRLENLYRRRMPPEVLVTPELARDLCLLSHEIRRQVGVLIERSGRIVFIVVGDTRRIVIPAPDDYRAAPGRLSGLRCIHTHLNDEPLTQDDLTDLALLRLDLMAAVGMAADGYPRSVHVAHLLPGAAERLPHRLLPPLSPAELDIDCTAMIQALEGELSRVVAARSAGDARERALLVGVSTASRRRAEESMAELKELARSGGVEVVGSVIQLRDQVDHRFLIGSGKLRDLAIQALQEGATVIVFDQELTPSQIRSITDQVEIKVIDRTQLILDIFAQRAETRDGKLQVELAQLKYLLPRLGEQGRLALSRLDGRHRRPRPRRDEARDRPPPGARAHQRSSRTRCRQSAAAASSAARSARERDAAGRLDRRLHERGQEHAAQHADRSRRARRGPAVRHARHRPRAGCACPRDREVIVITDTVGFIRDLPQDLVAAFRATLEELENADLLLHVIDAATRASKTRSYPWKRSSVSSTSRANPSSRCSTRSTGWTPRSPPTSADATTGSPLAPSPPRPSCP